jgi:hypothetical protein
MKVNLRGKAARLLALLVLGWPPLMAQMPGPITPASDPRQLDTLYEKSRLLALDETYVWGPREVLVPSDDDALVAFDTPTNVVDNRTWSSSASASLPSSEPSSDPSRPQPGSTSDVKQSFHWWAATKESLLFTGIMHTFDITSEAGTRDTLNGPLLRDYFRSVSELRGWSDSDTFMAPYVGHPIEGSIFGFIERQNDPRYKDVQWGDGRDYFISVLRSMAFSAVWHTQWKIGPLSEASIGNVMLHASPGFITLVDTPTLGALVMMAEDASDRYVIMDIENHTANRAVIILTRSFLNPGRTFANMMAFKVPWSRETRMGLNPQAYELRKEMLKEYKEGNGEKPFVYTKVGTSLDGIEFHHEYPMAAPIELMASTHYESFLGGGSCIGGGGQGAARLSDQFQIVAEVSGCLIMHMPAYNQSADSLLYMVGQRWTPLAATHRVSPYLQLMVGGRKVTHEIDDAALRTQLLKEWNDGNGTLAHYPLRSAWSTENAQNGVVVAAGGGVDWVVTRPFSWRILNVEYTHTWMPNVDFISTQNSVRVTTGAVLRIGTW